MLNQNDMRTKFKGVKTGVKQLWKKLSDKGADERDQADGVVDNGNHEFTPDDRVATAPRIPGSSSEAQNVVWDNEDASMQDKSYSFDEESTDADYENEDSLNFQDESDPDSGSGQADRYS